VALTCNCRFPTRAEVDRANFVRLKGLKGQSRTFKAVDSGKITDEVQRTKLLSNCMAPQEIELKTGAQVMLIKNLDESLVNGSLGKVVSFMDERTFDNYKDDEEGFIATQDMHSDDEKMSDAQRKLKRAIKTSTTSRLWPMVRFTLANGTTRDLLCTAENWKTELPNGEIQAQRDQVPLILAWALSIHKAQGQTLERVKVDLGKVFEKGQAYVALSRATSQAGLQVLRFEARKVMAHEKVRGFYDSLYDVDHVAGKKEENARGARLYGKSAGEYERKFLDDDLY
jgi:ATP-dependent DNA helicase PIF1